MSKNEMQAQDFDIYTYGSGTSKKGPVVNPTENYYPKGYLFKYGWKKTKGGPKRNPRKLNLLEDFPVFNYGSGTGKGPYVVPTGAYYPKGHFLKYGRRNISQGPKIRLNSEGYYKKGYIARYGLKKTVGGPTIPLSWTYTPTAQNFAIYEYGSGAGVGKMVKLKKKEKNMHPSSYHLNSKHKKSFKKARKYRKRKFKKLKGSDEATPDSQALEKIKKPKRMGSEAQIWD